jgi:hypothetical protein
VNVTVELSVELDGKRTKGDKVALTVNTCSTKSPALGAQPVLPRQPVTSIKYSPGETFPMMKLPLTIPVPTAMAQAAEPARTGLKTLPFPLPLIEHDWSVGRKPVPLITTDVPTGPDLGINVSLGPVLFTIRLACAKSPTLGAQPLLPKHPVISIMY